jgi:predicted transcriptional regulator of viral defense system
MPVELKNYGIIPVDYAAIVNLLSEYRSPKDKVARMESNGDLLRLKKGLYLVSPQLHGQLYSRELIANHLYGPSYVSLETALSYYDIIPERVPLVRSMTTKRAKVFRTPVGNFDYTKVNDEYFRIGLKQAIVDNQYSYLIATPEKAICDMIAYTHGLRLQSARAMRTYIDEDMRMDLSEIENCDFEIIRQAIDCGNKKMELKLLMEALQNV